MRYPLKSHRKIITIPPLCVELAELVGILAGDGAMTDWQFTISLNATRDAQYALHVQRLIGQLFGITSRTHNRNRMNCKVIVTSSKSAVEYLSTVGVVKGNKVKNIKHIPSWILERDEFAHAFARGLMDTDGCLYIHRHFVGGHFYKNIGLCFGSFSPPLVSAFVEILHKSGIPAKISRSGKLVYVYKQQGVKDYLRLIGTNNRRITSVYEKWRGG